MRRPRSPVVASSGDLGFNGTATFAIVPNIAPGMRTLEMRLDETGTVNSVNPGDISVGAVLLGG